MKTKVNLHRNVSAETLDNILSYLKDFAADRYNLIRFDGKVSIYFHDGGDARLLVENHGRFVDTTDEIYTSI
ncbi:MAG: hypothetical protein ACK4ZN_09005 [Oceanibaculum sp.]